MPKWQPKEITAHATIIVADIREPSNNPKAPLWVEDVNGHSWKLWKRDQAKFNMKKSCSYAIGYNEDTWEGKPQNEIITAQQVKAPAVTLPKAESIEQQYSTKDEIIFVESFGKKFIGLIAPMSADAITPTIIYHTADTIATALRAVYQKHWGPKKQVSVAVPVRPSHKDELQKDESQEQEFNDEIPY
jgi:hypothetical protein